MVKVVKVVNVSQLSDQLESICSRARDFEANYAADLAAVHPEFRDGARNLVHYLALRHEDIRELQEDLAGLGLSSLGRAEHNVMASIGMVQTAMQKMAGDTDHELEEECQRPDLRNPHAQLHNRAIFGDRSEGRNVSIMVTMPTDAGSDGSLVADMVAAGMNIARINCGHDDKQTWAAMIGNIRKVNEETGTECKIVMDLSGPKLRTGELLPGPRVIHIRPRRDALGRVLAPRRLRLIPDDVSWHRKKMAVIPVPRECIEFGNVGDNIRIRDTRGKKRNLKVVKKHDNELILESYKGAYIATGSKLRLERKDTGEKITYRVGQLPSIEQPILLHSGDTLLLHSEGTKGAPATEDAEGNVTAPAHIACQQPEVFEFVDAGDSISFNDGKITGTVRTVSEEQLEIEITRAKSTGSRLRGDCGINFPNSQIRLPGLTATDKTNLEFATSRVDAVGLSFVRNPADIIQLQEELEKNTSSQLGIITKIETEEGFNNLPELLLTTMRSYPAAIMIARGDLAVECGWERLAELQEEILWLCEAAHLPVIWATDVLNQESKKGHPSRAEITDAAMSQRADCVMLNKGPHILATIRMLDNILRRMQNHQYKKTARLRKLSISGAGT